MNPPPNALLSTSGNMRTSFTDSHRTLLYVLFWLFETLLIASLIVGACTDPRRDLIATAASGVTFCFSFIGLFAVCFALRRAAHRLAMIGWLTLLGAVCWSLLTPAL